MVKTGLDLFEKQWPKRFIGARVGLVVHPASVNGGLIHGAALFLKSRKCTLKALFGPQHGIRGETQDNMIEWEGFTDRRGVPVYSLYGESRIPGPSMMRDIDVMVIDLQDVGTRYYTYIWTMDLCMQACGDRGKSLIILDRPNPLGGIRTEGPVLDERFASFVGRRALPVRHGMTMGEIAGLLRDRYHEKVDLSVIAMSGWSRDMWFEETNLYWIFPSPNMPSPDTAVVYPGMCLLEGTNISEGRGTTRPFEVFGAPFIDAEKMMKELEALRLPGVRFRPLYFQPAFQKHAGKLCEGFQLHITSRTRFKPFKTGVAIIRTIRHLHPRDFQWKKPPYEYEMKKMPIDILCGSDRLRQDIDAGIALNVMEDWWKSQCGDFNRRIRKRYLIYR